MTSRKEFESARESLQKEADMTSKSAWDAYRHLTRVFKNIDAWTLLNELMQNAVDADATEVRINLHKDELEFRHNGSDPLRRRSVEGLCAFSKSTKGLNSVGFMGIGFKSFLKFFQTVTIYDQNISFCIDVRKKKTGNPELKDLYSPKWVDTDEDVKEETVFRFSKPLGSSMDTFGKDLEDFDPIRLAVLGMRKLEKVSIDEREYTIEKTGRGVDIQLGESLPRNFMIFEEEVHFSEQATQQLKKVRDSEEEDVTTTRIVRFVKEFDTKFSDKNGVVVSTEKPVAMDSGQAFCLVPLEGFNFPFKFGLDSDWLLNPDRTDFDDDGELWHQEIMNMIPKLIGKYIRSLSKEELSVEEWSECLDIFPDSENTLIGHLKYLNSDDFKKLMKEELAEIDFIRCYDGQFRKPAETRDFPINGSFDTIYPKINDTIYRKLIDEGCICPLLDRSAISKNTNQYLYNISDNSFLDWPEKTEINIQLVQSLWDPSKSNDYLQVLGIFAYIDRAKWESKGNSIEITPLQNGKWGKLDDSNLYFQPIPKTGRSKEKTQYDVLVNECPEISSLLEVHDGLKGPTPGKWARGWHWRNALTSPFTIERRWIGAEVSEIQVPIDLEKMIAAIQISAENVDLVLAIYHFSLRSNQPNLVKYIHTDSGVVYCNECFIGAPYETNASILQLFEGKTQSDEINTFAKKLRIKKEDKRKFLIDCGVRQFKPTLSRRICSDPKDASEFIGKSVDPPWKAGIWRATWSGNKAREGKKDAWTLRDHIWPLDFSKVDEIEMLSELLSNPPQNLRKAMKKASSQRSMTWYYKKKQEDPKPRKMPCQWLTDIRETAWVKCTDGGYRIPREAPIISGENSEIISAVINDDVVEFYSKIGVVFGSDLKGMSPEQRIDFWKREKFIDGDFFIKTLEDSGLEGEGLVNALLQSNFRTEGKKIAPIGRFITNPSSTFGGYFGVVEDLPGQVKKFMTKNSIQLPDSIIPHMLEEYINGFSNRTEEDFLRNLEHIRDAYSELIDQDQLDLFQLKYRTIEGEWVEPGNHELYLQLTADSFRLRDLNEQILDLRQFPSKVESLRRIYHDEWPISLIDNQIDFYDGEYGETITVVNLTRVVMSMNTSDIGFEIKQSGTDFLEVEFGGINLQLPYLVKDEDQIIHVYVNADTKSWAQPVAEFFGKTLGAPHVITDLNQALLYSDEEGFEVRYSQLCLEGKFGTISYNAARDIVLSKGENTEQPEGDSESDPKTDRTPIIREPTTDTSDKEEDGGKDKSTSPRKKKKEGKKKATKKLKVRKRKRGNSSQEIGDAGEDVVKEYLTENGWKVTNRNAFYGKAVEGSDLVAEKDGKKRIIEVKGTESDWTGSRSISWKQAVHALQYHDPENMYGRGHVTCWLYVVERVFDANPIVSEIDWCRLEPEFDFPLEWKESISGEEE